MELSLKAQLNRDLLAGQLSCEINSFTGWRRCLPVPTGFCEIGVYGGFFWLRGPDCTETCKKGEPAEVYKLNCHCPPSSWHVLSA